MILLLAFHPRIFCISFPEAEKLQNQLESLEKALVPLLAESSKQTQEIDELLETYERAVSDNSHVLTCKFTFSTIFSTLTSIQP